MGVGVLSFAEKAEAEMALAAVLTYSPSDADVSESVELLTSEWMTQSYAGVDLGLFGWFESHPVFPLALFPLLLQP